MIWAENHIFVSTNIIDRRVFMMKASISLDGLLKFILSLSLSARNKRWLGERLLEEAEKEESDFISKEEVLEGIDTGLREMQERKRSGKKGKTLSELIDEL